MSRYVKPPTALFNITNILFSLARRICKIVENEDLKEKLFKELRKKTLLEQKYHQLPLIEASILRANEIPPQILGQPKTAKKEESFLFTITYHPTNTSVFPIIKQSLVNFQYSKTMSNIFLRKKIVKFLIQAPNLCRLLCRPKFESQHKNDEVKNCGKNRFSCPYPLKASLYQFKRVNETFLLKTPLTVKAAI